MPHFHDNSYDLPRFRAPPREQRNSSSALPTVSRQVKESATTGKRCCKQTYRTPESAHPSPGFFLRHTPCCRQNSAWEKQAGRFSWQNRLPVSHWFPWESCSGIGRESMVPSGRIGLGLPPDPESNPLRLKINFTKRFSSLQLPYRETDPANALFHNSFSSQAISCCHMITYIARPSPSREGIFGDKTKILPANTDRQSTQYRRKYGPVLPQPRNDSIQFPAFFHKNGNFSRFPTDFDGFSTAKFVFQ